MAESLVDQIALQFHESNIGKSTAKPEAYPLHRRQWGSGEEREGE